jgi:transcription termination factor Rho
VTVTAAVTATACATAATARPETASRPTASRPTASRPTGCRAPAAGATGCRATGSRRTVRTVRATVRTACATRTARASRDGPRATAEPRDDDEFSGGRAALPRARRGRNRNTGDRFGSEPEPVVSDDDVLVPSAGSSTVLDNYGFIRTSATSPGRTTST